MRNFQSVCCFILALSTFVGAARSGAEGGNRVHNITRDLWHPTIQAAIDAAEWNDELAVEQGVYAENIQINKKITLRSTDPADPAVVAATVIDGGGVGSAVTFIGYIPGAALSGFTITNGHADYGGGINGNAQYVTVENNNVTTNTASLGGGGIYRVHGPMRNNLIAGNRVQKAQTEALTGGGLLDCDGYILSNTITRNTVHHFDSMSNTGGGLADCDGVIEHNIITQNSAGLYWFGSSPRVAGGGLYNCQAAIRHNIIDNNETSHGGGLSRCNGEISDNQITNNWGDWGGGGLESCQGVIKGNTIEYNHTPEQGGGLLDCNGLIANNLIRHNRAGRWGGGGLDSCSGELMRNTIAFNTGDIGGVSECGGRIEGNWIHDNSGYEGGAIKYGGWSVTTKVIVNNVITSNTTTEGASGVGNYDGLVLNNTIAFNKTLTGAGAGLSCSGIVANNIIWGNENPSGLQIDSALAPSYCLIQDWAGGGEGNIAADPRLEADGYHLRADSPAINAGSNDGAVILRDSVVAAAGASTAIVTTTTIYRVADQIDFGADGALRKVTFIDSKNSLIAFDTPLAAPAAAGTLIRDFGRGEIDGEYRIADGAVDIGADELAAPVKRVRNTMQEAWFPTIQSAIDAARDGDELVAEPNTYFENVRFAGKNVTLRSTEPANPDVVSRTVINGSGASSVIVFSGDETPSCALKGFTITNGAATMGGGILGNGTHATIEHNQVTSNTATLAGGGIHQCHGLIARNLIAGNLVHDESVGSVQLIGGGLFDCDGLITTNTIERNQVYGWGVYLSGGGLAKCDGAIEGNTIAKNWVDNTDWGSGGGLYECDGVIRHNTIVNNFAFDAGAGLDECDGEISDNVIDSNATVVYGGGGLRRCDGFIARNVVEHNFAGMDGGAFDWCDGTITGNIIRYNMTGSFGCAGGLNACSGNILNNVISFNSGDYFGGLSFCNGTIAGNTVTGNTASSDEGNASGIAECTGVIANNIIWGNADRQIIRSSAPTHCLIQDWTEGGEGNIALDPQLEADGYHLRADSPAINTGSTDAAAILHDRVVNGEIFVNAVIVTTSSLYRIGDEIEIGGDGVLRTVTQVGPGMVIYDTFLATPAPIGTEIRNFGQGDIDGDNRILLDTADIGADETGLATIPSVSIMDTHAAEGDSGTGLMTFNIFMSAVSDSTVSVAFTTVAGTAAASQDFVTTSGTITFEPGQFIKSLSVRVIGDSKLEPDETVIIRFKDPVGATIAKGQATGTILNDDSGLVIEPAEGINAAGPEGGPFTPGSKTYTFTNSGGTNLTWSFGTDAFWLNLFNGGSWEQATAAAGFSPRFDSASAVLNGKLWVVGGLSGARRNDVWSSEDGIHWTLVTPAAAFSPREGHTCTAFANKLWVIGGWDGSSRLSDVWSSEDGANWTRVTAAAGFSGRFWHTCLAFKDKLWVIGGEYNADVWYSPDGAAWTQATANAAFGNRSEHASTVFNDRMWVIGGIEYSILNDAWSSADGVTWTQATGNAGFAPRLLHACAAMNGKLWVIGGSNGSSSLNDVWSSPDGINWTEAAPHAPFLPRANLEAAVFKEKIWVFCGAIAGGTGSNDVWSTRSDLLSGTLAPGASTSIDVTINEEARSLTAGVYTGKLISGDDTLGINRTQNAQLTIEAMPSVWIGDASLPEGDSGTARMNFTVTMSAAVSFPVSVQFTTTDSTAVAGQDYETTAGTVVFEPGESSKQLPVIVNGDARNEPNEDFLVILSNPSCAQIFDRLGTGTIVTDDGNEKPVAMARSEYADCLICVGRPETLDGSRSYDPGGLPLTYQWSIVQSPKGCTASIMNNTSPVASLQVDKAGCYKLRLVVSNSNSSDSADLTVKALQPGPLAGDFNRDGVVNSSDLGLFRPHMNSRRGDENYDAAYDLNSDNRIDAADLRLVMADYGSCCYPARETSVDAETTPAAPIRFGANTRWSAHR